MKNKQDVIRDHARSLWEQAGCPSGMDVSFWLQAENLVQNAWNVQEWYCFPIDSKIGSLWGDLTLKEQLEILVVIPDLFESGKHRLPGRWRKE